MKRKVVVKKSSIIMLSITLLGFILSIVLTFKAFDFKELLNNKLLYSYTPSKQVNYDISVFPNSLFDDDDFNNEDNKNIDGYIANLLDDINIDFKYNFQTSVLSNLEYTYKIVAELNSEYMLVNNDNQNTNIWSKTYTLLEPITNKITGTTFTLDKLVTFDYDYYNDLMKTYQSEIKLSTNSKAIVKMIIEMNGTMGDDKFHDVQEISLEIPLNEPVIQITNTTGSSDEVKVYRYPNPKVKLDKKQVLLGAFIGLISLLLLIISFRKIKADKNNYYMLTLNKILKEYGDVVIEVLTPADLNKVTTIEVKNFNEMIDLEERLHIPINFCETKKNKEGLFWLRYNDQYYKYVLKNK